MLVRLYDFLQIFVFLVVIVIIIYSQIDIQNDDNNHQHSDQFIGHQNSTGVSTGAGRPSEPRLGSESTLAFLPSPTPTRDDIINNLKCSKTCPMPSNRTTLTKISLDNFGYIRKNATLGGFGPFKNKTVEDMMLTKAENYMDNFWSNFNHSVEFPQRNSNRISIPEIYHYIYFGCIGCPF